MFQLSILETSDSKMPSDLSREFDCQTALLLEIIRAYKKAM